MMGPNDGALKPDIFPFSASSTMAILAPVRVDRLAAILKSPSRRLENEMLRLLLFSIYLMPDLLGRLGILMMVVFG